MLSFEILHERIQRLPWYLQHRGHISASQCAGTSNCGKHVTNALRLDGQTRLLCSPRRWRALRMVQARQGHSINLASPQPLKRFDKLGGEQAFEGFLYYVLGHAHREPYLCRVGYILTRDCRQNAFLLARQKARLVPGTHYQPEGVLLVGDTQISA